MIIKLPVLQFDIIAAVAVFADVACDHDEIRRGFFQHFQRFGRAAGVPKLVALCMLHNVANQVFAFDSAKQ